MKFYIKLLTIIFGPVVTAIVSIRKEIKKLDEPIGFKYVLGDFFFVARNTGFVMVPSLLAGAIFLFLPQGRDTLLLVVEKMDEGDYRQLFFFLLGIVVWSCCAELSIRYAIAISDNSGKNLRDSRVYWRKLSQRILASFSLFWPSLMVIMALFWCYGSATYLETPVKLAHFGPFFLAVFAIVRVFSYLYFYRKKRIGSAPARTILGARSLPTEEYNWVNRLYGIYNEFVYTLLKPSNFKGAFREKMQGFTDSIIGADDRFRSTFPQNADAMSIRRVVPSAFKPIFSELIVSDRGDSYRWRYRIPTSFYPGFHRQVFIMAIVSVAFLLYFSFLKASTGFFGVVGAPALLCFAFATYSGLYAGLLYLDYGWLRGSVVQLRWVLAMWLLVVSLINHDHPVNMTAKPTDARKNTSEQFAIWYKQYKAAIDSIYPGTNRYPVVFVCAEGGALRTGAYTSFFLTRLQHDFIAQGIDFKRSIFGLSGVSGGAVGLAYYHAKAFSGKKQHPDKGADINDAIKFFRYDCLSPIIGKMFFGDFLNLFIPYPVQAFDRAIALEESWKNAYGGTLDKGEQNRFAQQFVDKRSQNPLEPLLIINTAEVESGYQCWVSNMQTNELFEYQKRDLVQNKVKGMSYSTAVNFSTRFPLFSPAAEIDTLVMDKDGCHHYRYHYVDGGYVENTGAGSTLELLNILAPNETAYPDMQPIVIYLRFSNQDNRQAKNIRMANELVEIVAGIYNTRVGRSFTAMGQLNQWIRSRKGLIVDAPLMPEQRDVPMNWVLSKQSIENIKKDIDQKLKDTAGNPIREPLFDKNIRYVTLPKK